MGQARILERIAAAMALAALFSGPALAQQAKTAAQAGSRIVVTGSNLAETYTALGVVSANVHPKSMNPKTPTKDLLDARLREAAAKLGADAVVQVRYTLRNPMMSSKGSDAIGVAVKFTNVAATAPSLPVAPPPASTPQIAAPAVAPPRRFASATPAPSAPAPAARVEAAVPSAVAAPPPVARHATSADMIVLTDRDTAGRRHTRVGDVRSEVHQKSIFPKTPSRDLLNADLREQAFRLGADAVVEVVYEMHNALTSTKGDIATGVAVRFE